MKISDEILQSIKRYTFRQLNTQAKQTFRRIQIDRPEGGAKPNYRYRGWDIIINNNGHVAQMLNYDVTTTEEIVKRARTIPL
jgi:hypothetical protein